MMAVHAISTVLSTTKSYFSLLSPTEDNFVTGNVSALRLRSFDYSLKSIPTRKNVSFGLSDTEFSNVKYLNCGSSSVVYTGLKEDKVFAVKMLKPTSKYNKIAVEEMHIEMLILSRVVHENIITIYGAGEISRKFIMLEYLGGGTLEHQLHAHQRSGNHAGLPWETVLPIIMDLAAALKYLNEDFHPLAMIIHRGT